MSDHEDYRPIQGAGGAHTEEGWVFHVPGKDLAISGFQQEINEILALSNGVNRPEHILGHLATKGFDEELCSAIIDDLGSAGVLVDSREQHLHFHGTSNNPSLYFRDLGPAEIAEITNNDPFAPKEGVAIEAGKPQSALEELLEKRSSCRSFSDESVPMDVIASSLRAAYAKELRPSPSAGGLYPLRLYFIKRNSGDTSSGIYQYDHVQDSIIGYGEELDEEAFKYALNSETFVFNADTVAVIAADLKRHSQKYANRGYRYSLIEAGHVAQNMHLALAGHGVSSVEYGGFNDAALKKELSLGEDEEPLITIGLGYSSDKECITGLEIADNLSSLVGEKAPIEWVNIDFDSETAKQAGFYVAFAKFKRPNEAYGSEEHQFASGTSTSIQMAYVKAVAEAYERYKGGEVRIDKSAPANELELPWLDPRSIRPLTKSQIEASDKLEVFSETKPIDWVKVKRYPEGEEYYAPIDLVFYPLDASLIGRTPVAEADSSGMAAHIDKDTAIKKATLELVERDAIMKSWLEKDNGERIAHNILDSSWRRRIEKIEEQQGKAVDIVDLSHDGVVIINVIIRSPDGSYPFFVNGSSASDSSFNEALSKAFDEAELGLLEAINQDEVEALDLESVRSPADHGKLYLHDTHRDAISWLWAGPIKNTLPQATTENVVRQFSPFILEYTQDQSPIHVVRAICPQLVPINFGFGNEHYTHISVQKDGRVRPTIPHYFA